MHKLKYLVGVVLSIPLLPIIFFQGSKIKGSTIKLPEAKGTTGNVGVINSEVPLRLLVLGESTVAGVGVETHEEGFAGT